MQPTDEHPDRRERRERLERLVETARADLRSWTDAPVHDPAVALLELFAFLGDALSSYADAVGRESFLPTTSRAPEACGIHRAVVVDAGDPQAQGRLLVEVPSVLGPARRWALPCQPAGASVELPSAGASVWVAFEACDLDRPVWLGRAP